MGDIIRLVTAMINRATAIILYKAARRTEELPRGLRPSPPQGGSYLHYICHANEMQEITLVVSVVAFVIAVAACYKAIRR